MIHPELMRMLLARQPNITLNQQLPPTIDQFQVVDPTENVGPQSHPQRSPGQTPGFDQMAPIGRGRNTPAPMPRPTQMPPPGPQQPMPLTKGMDDIAAPPFWSMPPQHDPSKVGMPAPQPSQMQMPQQQSVSPQSNPQGYWDRLFADPNRTALLRFGLGAISGEGLGKAMDAGMNMRPKPDDPYTLGPGQTRFDRNNRPVARTPFAPTKGTQRRMFKGADGYNYWADDGTRVNPNIKAKEKDDVLSNAAKIARDMGLVKGTKEYNDFIERYAFRAQNKITINNKLVPPGQVEKINELRGLGTSLDLVESHFGKNFSNLKDAVGKWQNIKQSALEWFGQAGYDTQEIRRLSEDLVDQLARLRTGAVINADEEERFKRLIPNATDEVPTFMNKFNGFRTQLEALIKSRIQTAEDFGYATGGASQRNQSETKEYTYNPETGKIEPK